MRNNQKATYWPTSPETFVHHGREAIKAAKAQKAMANRMGFSSTGVSK